MASAVEEPPLALFLLRLISPAFVFLSALSLVFARPPSHDSPSSITPVVVAVRIPRRALILSLLTFSALTYFLDGFTFILYAIIDKIWPQNTGIDINAVIGLVAFSGLAAFGAWKDVHGVEVWFLKRVKASLAISLVLDIAQVILIGLSIRSLRDSPPIGIPEDNHAITIDTLLHFAIPCLRILFLIPLIAGLLSPRVIYTSVQTGDSLEAPEPDATTGLLHSSEVPPSAGLSPVTAVAGNTSKYGTFSGARPTAPTSRPVTGTTTPSNDEEEKDEKPEMSLREFIRRVRRIAPYLWPSKSWKFQVLAALCILLLVAGRFLNAIVPFTLGEVVRVFEEHSSRSPWPYLFAYVGLRFLQSGGGLSALRDILWMPVMQYSDREMAQLSFDHLLNLSFSFHTHRKTGEILRLIDRGSAINNTLELVLFNVLPTVFDIIVALIIFCFKFGWLLSLVITIVMFSYVAVSILLTTWRTKIRRKMNDYDVATRGIYTDCLLNYETVKYFCGEEHESVRFRQSLRDYQGSEYNFLLSMNLLSLIQNFFTSTGLLIGSMIIGRQVTNGELKPSDFVIFITYLSQLYGPLMSLGYIYRAVNQTLVDTEKLLDLLNEQTEINDKPDAPDLVVNHGEIEFQNVSFSYDSRSTALNGISFKVPKGSSVALVGESGAGKSTVLRLLYRFYDLGDGNGKILIDGQDIKEVTQKSLRKAIGVVPQDPVLFNSTIGYNIGYGKFGASSEDIEHAARLAQMHERIATFSNGYDTTVGERGIRLSGGEKQRVAIARTLLKDPPVLLLDEATSSLDTSTEKDIQKALQNLIKGRSSLSIAHRLSTIASADVILVLKDGQIIEKGNHKELLALDGVFASMWADQILASADPSGSNENGSLKKEASGYRVDSTDSAPLIDVDEAPEEATAKVFDGDLVATPEIVPEPLPSEDAPGDAVTDMPGVDRADAADATPREEAGAEPEPQALIVDSPISPISPAVSFPSSDAPAADSAQSPGVTFGSEVNTPPRSGTPDPESEPKRKRISSQNFQRLARKMSLTTRRTGSTSSIPIISGLLRNNSPRGSTDGTGRDGEGVNADSPSSSLTGETDKMKNKKDKDRKRRSIL